MKLSDYLEAYYDATETASDVSRKIAFAGIALIWVFRIDSKPVPHVPQGLVLPAFLFALCLALDLIQYLVKTLIWGIFHAHHQRKLANPAGEDPELSHPDWLTWSVHIPFVLKVIAVISAYVFVSIYIVSVW